MRVSTYTAKFRLILVAGLTARVGYVLAQPATDPTLGRPILDGLYYLEWARALASGAGGPEGAYYLAPLYPHLLAGFLLVLGERFSILYLLQHAMVVATAGLLAHVARKSAGDAGALATAAICLLFHPLLFFASRPVGEAPAIFLLAVALVAAVGEPATGRAVVGLAAGLGALARPNLLLVAVLWAAGDAARRRWKEATLVALGCLLVVLPVMARNLAVSGHPVPVSSNGGITLYHGNGPGATGIFTPPRALSGRLDTQREEATLVARERTARPLDPVEADRWWGREALRARVEDPAGTARLLAWRFWLLLDSYEHSLDYAPALDANPWRWSAPIPFAALLGLAAAGVALRGIGGTGGGTLWSAIAAAAAMPVAFYASSRYRLPLAALLSVPAGVGAAALLGRHEGVKSLARRTLAVGVGGALALVSLLVPSGDLRRSEEAGALANLADVAKKSGDLAGAERFAREAVLRDPRSPIGWFNLGVVLAARGRPEEAEAAYRRVLEADPGHAEAAGNLAGFLVGQGRAAEAVPLLRRALESRPTHAVCWTNLVVALVTLGDAEGAREAAAEAARKGAALAPELLQAIGLVDARPGGSW